MAAVFASWLFGFLGFLGGRPQPAQTLGRLALLSSASMMVVYAAVSCAFLLFKIFRTVEAEPIDPVHMESDTGPVLNRAASNYPYRSHLQWARAAFAMVGCTMFLLFNGYKSMLHPLSIKDFVASYVCIPIFIVIVMAYHVKDEREWRFWRWTRRATMEVQNPMETSEKDPLLRRGRLHRKNLTHFWAKENLRQFGDFIWVWLK